MVYVVPQPPNIDGIMVLTDAEKNDILPKIKNIISSFFSSDDFQEVNTFYITSTYNRAFPSNPINGDTCEYLLKGE